MKPRFLIHWNRKEGYLIIGHSILQKTLRPNVYLMKLCVIYRENSPNVIAKSLSGTFFEIHNNELIPV